MLITERINPSIRIPSKGSEELELTRQQIENYSINTLKEHACESISSREVKPLEYVLD
jgi:hypothetical protein